MYLKTALTKQPLSQLLEESLLTDSQQSRDMIPPTDDDVLEETTHVIEEDIRQDSQNKSENTTEEIDCPCTCKQESRTNILTCSICERKQHSICYGILEPDENKSEFHCIQCINETPFKSSQEDLIYTYEGKQQQELAALRRALVFCASLKNVTSVQVEKHLKCSKQLAKDLTERLEFEGFIKKTGVKNRYTVNEKKIIHSGYQEYFSRAENKENEKNSQKTRLTQVEKLNLKGPFENPPKRNLRRRRSLPTGVNSDSDEESEHQPKKKLCKNTKERVLLK